MYGDPLGRKRRTTETAYEWVMANLAPGPNGCIEFTGARTGRGYGQVTIDYQRIYAHRIVLAHHQGWRDGMYALHSCDNPPCVNPDHLRWGTQRENMDDVIARRRHVRPRA